MIRDVKHGTFYNVVALLCRFNGHPEIQWVLFFYFIFLFWSDYLKCDSVNQITEVLFYQSYLSSVKRDISLKYVKGFDIY